MNAPFVPTMKLEIPSIRPGDQPVIPVMETPEGIFTRQEWEAGTPAGKRKYARTPTGGITVHGTDYSGGRHVGFTYRMDENVSDWTAW